MSQGGGHLMVGIGTRKDLEGVSGLDLLRHCSDGFTLPLSEKDALVAAIEREDEWYFCADVSGKFIEIPLACILVMMELAASVVELMELERGQA